MDIKHILVASDLSPSSEVSYRYAALLARVSGARVTVLTVDPIAPMGFHTSSELVNYIENVQSVIRARLSEAEQFFSDRGITALAEEVTGDPSGAILDFIVERGVDLLVMSRRSKSTLERWLLGSTTRKLVRHVEIPTLLVDGQMQLEGEPGFSRMMTTTDFSVDSHQGIQASSSLAGLFGATLDVVHILALPMIVPSIPGEAGVPMPGDFWEQLRRFYEGELSEVVTELGAEASYRVVVGADIAPTLSREASENDVDLILVPSHGKGGMKANIFGSTSERLLELSKKPVMVLPRPWLNKMAES